MKFLSVRELRGNSAQVWKTLAKEQEMIVTNNGRPIAILSATVESNLEENLNAIRRARAVSAVAKLQRQSVERGLDKINQTDIQTETEEIRRNRPK